MDTLFNDERLVDVANIDSHIQNEHKLRYKLATLLVKNKRVLDVACGSGYGSEMLSREAKHVIGVDYSQAVIDYCINKYQSDNLEFKKMSAETLEFPEHSFDVIVSFETLEHLTEEAQKQFMINIKKILTKDGMLIMSSPNREVWSRMINKEDNKYHLHELNETEFKSLLNTHFSNVDFYYQNYIPTSFVTSLENKSEIKVVLSDNFTGYDLSTYGIALCSDANIDADFAGMYVPQLSQAYNELTLGFVDICLYCDSGNGFCEADKLHAPLRVLADGRLCAEFELTKNASSLRLDPGEQPCCLSQFEISDKSLSCVAHNGIELEENKFLFYDYDPILLVKGREHYMAGEKIVFAFQYEQPNYADISKQLKILAEKYLALEKRFFLDGKEVNKQEEYYLGCLRDKDVHIQNLETAVREKDVHIRNLETAVREKDVHIGNLESIIAVLKEEKMNQLIENMKLNTMIKEIHQSLSWKLTAPLRRISAFIHRRK